MCNHFCTNVEETTWAGARDCCRPAIFHLYTMTHFDGKRTEQYFQRYIRKRLQGGNVKLVHQPFDFIVNGHYVEVKSAKLYTKDAPDKYVHGRYECWSKKQLAKMKRLNPWVCFIIQHDRQYLVQGFAKAKDIPNMRRMTFRSIQHIPLKTTKQFVKYMQQSCNKK